VAVNFSPIGNSQTIDENGDPAVGWKWWTYVAGTSTPLATYTDSGGGTAQSNPIVINALGFPTVGQIWLTESVGYKLVLTDDADVVQKTEDNITGVAIVSAASFTEWISYTAAPTYISATSFSVAGDQRTIFNVGRRLKTSNTAGTIYSTISDVAYTSLTTVTVVNDSGTLDSGLSAVSYGIVSSENGSIPIRRDVIPAFADVIDPTKQVRVDVGAVTTATTRILTLPDHDVGDATTTASGFVELATDAETLTGTDAIRAVTPAGLASQRGMVKLTSGTVSNQATADLVLTAYSAYKKLTIRLRRIFPATDGALLRMQTSTDGGLNYDAGASDYARSNFGVDNLSATAVEGNSGTSSMEITPSFGATKGIGSAASEGANAEVVLLDRQNTARFCQIFWSGSYITSLATTGSVYFSGSGCRQAAADVDAVRFLMSSGNISLEYEIWGD